MRSAWLLTAVEGWTADESGEVVYESSLISVSQDVKTVTG